MSLDEWRQEKGLSYENLARLLSFTTSKTYRLCNNSSCMKLADAHKIVSVSNGDISFEDLLPLEGDCV